MPSSSNELSTSVSDSAKCELTRFNTYALIPELTLSRRLGLGTCHQSDIKLEGFHEVLQTTIIRQITKGNEEIEKIEKYSQKPLELYTNLYMCFCGGGL